jgi:hypothetical protein
MNLHEPNRQTRIKLSKLVRAVKLQEQPGSSLRNPTGTLVEIPAGVIVEIEGAAAPSGLCNILWNGDAFSVFYEDLKENGRILDSAR